MERQKGGGGRKGGGVGVLLRRWTHGKVRVRCQIKYTPCGARHAASMPDRLGPCRGPHHPRQLDSGGWPATKRNSSSLEPSACLESAPRLRAQIRPCKLGT